MPHHAPGRHAFHWARAIICHVIGLYLFIAAAQVLLSAASAQAQTDKPNILVLWGDDVGITNISFNNRGMMGYRTPNIDRIANEGMSFTDYYGEQSCTAGRSSFITGQSVFRTGLSKVGLPGADLGMREEDPTIAGLLKEQGYATGQFGKNHLGDKNEHLPTNHGFDQFFGNLYHLNAEEEPEHPDYPRDAVMPDGQTFLEKFGPRGVIRSSANYDGDQITQEIEDTGPLTRERMKVIDDETSDAAIEFIREQTEAGNPWFVWWNGTRMHFRTHIKDEIRGISGQNEYADAMVEHDMHVGKFLDLLDELGIADDTLVFYSTDNGPHMNTWPDAAMTPFRGEKNTNFEGGWRVPAFVRWPGQIEAGAVTNEIVHHMDWLPTLLAIAGDPNVQEKLRTDGMEAIGRDYRVHLDGYNILPLLKGEADESPRKEIFYFTDDGDLSALRYQDWKVVFLEQRRPNTLEAWSNPFTPLRIPLLFNLRRDPYERAQITSNTYYDWLLDRAFVLVPAQAYVQRFLETFKEFPPRQKPASFSIDQVMEALEAGAVGAR
ncbi:arylsulfatase [Dichotomicrobium thermohalophilum]|uniref:Arylsulfatase n=1 Tax=Dichotomicrobium thermohalophilum TaxID=933063 RepID=A0A397P927_9HYPH|nr:arylsulfatase [Dichotomicrobium thermohalophilum]RIA45418.1 arylsulfatase [Dichotomicrobium thermohalophilum]